MELKKSKPYQAANKKISQSIANRNTKRGHVSHLSIFARENGLRKARSLAVAALAIVGFGGMLKTGLEAISDSKDGYALAVDAGAETKNCVTKGLAGCALSSPETTVVVTTVSASAEGSPEVSSIMACADEEEVSYQGPLDMPMLKIAELNPELTPAQVSDVYTNAFWDKNATFDPNTLQQLYDNGQKPFFFVPEACAPYGG